VRLSILIAAGLALCGCVAFWASGWRPTSHVAAHLALYGLAFAAYLAALAASRGLSRGGLGACLALAVVWRADQILPEGGPALEIAYSPLEFPQQPLPRGLHRGSLRGSWCALGAEGETHRQHGGDCDRAAARTTPVNGAVHRPPPPLARPGRLLWGAAVPPSLTTPGAWRGPLLPRPPTTAGSKRAPLVARQFERSTRWVWAYAPKASRDVEPDSGLSWRTYDPGEAQAADRLG
jgi:hypothetical protein